MITSEMIIEAKQFVFKHGCSSECGISKTTYVRFGTRGLSVTKIQNKQTFIKHVNCWMEKTVEEINFEIKNQSWMPDD